MRSQGTRESLDFFWRSFEAPRYQVNANHCVFSSDFLKMTIEERDFARMSEDLGTTIWRLLRNGSSREAYRDAPPRANA